MVQLLLKYPILMQVKLLNVSLATDGQDGNRLQLENVAGPTSSSAVVCTCYKNRLKLIMV